MPPSRLRCVLLLVLAVVLPAGCAAAPSHRPAAALASSPAPAGPASPIAPSMPAGPPASPAPPAACPTLPADNVWHADISHLPVRADSARLVRSIGVGSQVHADFGSGLWQGAPIGIPVTTVGAGQPQVPVSFQYRSESDPGPYPVPAGAQVEGGRSSSGDRHVIIYDPTHCRDYELYAAYPQTGGAWRAGSGAVYDLRSNVLRPAGWTSADAAGLPILPGLVRYAEVRAGHIDHAIRVTVPASRASYLWPARHQAGASGDPALPAMGLRLRLRGTVSIAGLPAQARVVAAAMQRYGVIVADNGAPWYLSGAPDPGWNNDALHALGTLTGADFEAVDTAPLMINANSAAFRG